MSSKLHFKYGTQGFIKRFGVWHDILITYDLMEGLEILGYTNVRTRFEAIKSPNDIAEFVMSSPLFGVDILDELNIKGRRAIATRPTTNYIMDKLRASGISQKIKDEDYFFKKL